MAWEQRRHKKYYFRYSRVDGVLRKVYLGSGPDAEKQAKEDAEAQRRREEERTALRAEAASTVAADHAHREFRAVSDLLLRATLVLAGFHQRRSEWRRWRTRHGQEA